MFTYMKSKTPTKKKPPAFTRETGRPTINAKLVDKLLADISSSVMALQLALKETRSKEPRP
jgi:hypothetical protein